MTPPASTSRLLLSALLLGAAFPARAGEAGAAVPVPKADTRSAAQKLQEQIKDACEAEAVEIRLLDPAATGPVKEGATPPPNVKRESEATSVANKLGAGVESEEDQAGQTLTRKRGKTTKEKCRTDVARVARMYPGRFSVEPTTEARVEKVKAVREALFGKALTANPGDAATFESLVTGAVGRPDGQVGAGPVAAAAALSPAMAAPMADNRPGRPTLQAYRGPLTSATPPPVIYSPATFSETVSGYYRDATASVSSGLNQAGEWVTGVARSVRNGYYSGIEMIQGYGYKFIHAARGTNWGTKPFVDGLRKIAAYMYGLSGTQMAIGDLSSASGGQLGRHKSHKRGVDADIGYYMTDTAGKPVEAMGFVQFNRDLTGVSGGKTVRFDAQRNWFLVEAILANRDPGFEPEYIFIDAHLERAILAAAGNSPEAGRAAALMRPEPGHANHLHLRIKQS